MIKNDKKIVLLLPRGFKKHTHNSNMYSNIANVSALSEIYDDGLLRENAILLKKLRDGEKEIARLEKKLAQATIKVAKKQLVDTSKAQKAISKALAAEDRRVAKNVVKEAILCSLKN